MKDITHKNHYVPQFYLKNWSQDRKKIWVYSLIVPHAKLPYWQQKSIEYIAVWNDFYTRHNGEKEVDDFEKWFNKEFETPVEPVINKLIDNNPITRQEEILLTHYVMAQDLRVPARVNFILDSAKESVKNFMDSFSLENVTKEDILNFKHRAINDLLPINVHVDREKQEMEMRTFVGKSVYLYSLKFLLTSTIKKVEHYRWHVVHAADGVSFPTSDNPVILLNYYGNNNYDFKGGWGVKHVNIIMPLSPECLLFTEVGATTESSKFYTREWSGFFRKIIIEHAYRYVFAYEKQKGMLSINPRRVSKERFLAEKETMNGWHEYNMKAERELLSK